MKKHFLFLFTLFLFSHINAQSTAAAGKSGDAESPTEFLKKLEAYVTLSQQQQAVETYKAFEKKFKGGSFTDDETNRLMAICNDMLTARLNATPYFVDFLGSSTQIGRASCRERV